MFGRNLKGRRIPPYSQTTKIFEGIEEKWWSREFDEFWREKPVPYLMDQAPREHQDRVLGPSACCIRAERAQNSISERHTAREGQDQRGPHGQKGGRSSRQRMAQMSRPKAWQYVVNPSPQKTFTQPCISGVIPRDWLDLTGTPLR